MVRLPAICTVAIAEGRDNSALVQLLCCYNLPVSWAYLDCLPPVVQRIFRHDFCQTCLAAALDGGCPQAGCEVLSLGKQFRHARLSCPDAVMRQVVLLVYRQTNCRMGGDTG